MVRLASEPVKPSPVRRTIRRIIENRHHAKASPMAVICYARALKYILCNAMHLQVTHKYHVHVHVEMVEYNRESHVCFHLSIRVLFYGVEYYHKLER